MKKVEPSTYVDTNGNPVTIIDAVPVPVQAQPVIYQAEAIVPEEITYERPQYRQPNNLPIPYPDEQKWHHSEFERCFSCKSDCWIAWCCPCIPLAHIASKLSALSTPYCLSFNTILYCGVGLSILDFILTIFGVTLYPQYIFYIIVCFQLRGLIRKRLNISGDTCHDCLCSCFCLPCILTQINGTFWKNPEQYPGRQ